MKGMIYIKIIGIYKIENLENKKVYIGESFDIADRWLEHINHLLNNKHHSFKLQNDFNKYGIEKFKFEVLEILIPSDTLFKTKMNLIYLENQYIKQYNSFENGYNCEITIDNILLNKKFVFDKTKDRQYLLKLFKDSSSIKLLDYNQLQNKVKAFSPNKKDDAIETKKNKPINMQNVFAELHNSKIINDNTTMGEVKGKLVELGILKYYNHSYHTTEKSLKENIFENGKTYINSYGFEYKKIIVTDYGCEYIINLFKDVS